MSVTDRIEPDGRDNLASLPDDPVDVDVDAGDEEHADDERAARFKDFIDWLNDSA